MMRGWVEVRRAPAQSLHNMKTAAGGKHIEPFQGLPLAAALPVPPRASAGAAGVSDSRPVSNNKGCPKLCLCSINGPSILGMYFSRRSLT